MSKKKTNKTEKCKAETNAGNRCKRNAWKDGYCKQHHESIVSKQPKFYELPGGTLNIVPQCPDHFDDMQKGLWRQLCEQLIQRKKLEGGHLFTIIEVCENYKELHWVRQQLTSDNIIMEHKGGSQISGYVSFIDKTEKRIAYLLKHLGLNVPVNYKPAKESKSPMESYFKGRAKNF